VIFLKATNVEGIKPISMLDACCMTAHVVKGENAKLDRAILGWIS
jgi:hypothetical protein